MSSSPYPEVPLKLIFRERVNIFERGIHKRIRRIKRLDDDRWLSHEGKEEEPALAEENVDEIFSALFGERMGARRSADEALGEVLGLAGEQPDLFTAPDQPAAADPEQAAHLFDEEQDDPAPPEDLGDEGE